MLIRARRHGRSSPGAAFASATGTSTSLNLHLLTLARPPPGTTPPSGAAVREVGSSVQLVCAARWANCLVMPRAFDSSRSEGVTPVGAQPDAGPGTPGSCGSRVWKVAPAAGMRRSGPQQPRAWGQWPDASRRLRGDVVACVGDSNRSLQSLFAQNLTCIKAPRQ